jgi:hypothetical protein
VFDKHVNLLLLAWYLCREIVSKRKKETSEQAAELLSVLNDVCITENVPTRTSVETSETIASDEEDSGNEMGFDNALNEDDYENADEDPDNDGNEDAEDLAEEKEEVFGSLRELNAARSESMLSRKKHKLPPAQQDVVSSSEGVVESSSTAGTNARKKFRLSQRTNIASSVASANKTPSLFAMVTGSTIQYSCGATALPARVKSQEQSEEEIPSKSRRIEPIEDSTAGDEGTRLTDWTCNSSSRITASTTEEITDDEMLRYMDSWENHQQTFAEARTVFEEHEFVYDADEAVVPVEIDAAIQVELQGPGQEQCEVTSSPATSEVVAPEIHINLNFGSPSEESMCLGQESPYTDEFEALTDAVLGPDEESRLQSFANGISSLLIPESPFESTTWSHEENGEADGVAEDWITDYSSHMSVINYQDNDDAILLAAKTCCDATEMDVVVGKARHEADTLLASPVGKSRSSPLLSQFTASKLKRTPGKYLCLPLVGLCAGPSSTNNRQGMMLGVQTPAQKLKQQRDAKLALRNTVLKNRRTGNVFSSSTGTVSLTASDVLRQEEPRQCRDADMDEPLNTVSYAELAVKSRNSGSENSKFVCKNLSEEEDCRASLQQLVHSNCVAFELNYRSLPRRSHQDEGWNAFVCPLVTDGDIVAERNLLHMADNGGVASSSRKASTCIAGVAFNFGDEVSYYMSLPCPLPLSQSVFNLDCSMENAPMAVGTSKKVLDSLPISCRVMICRYVGFPGIFHQCHYLVQRRSAFSGQNNLSPSNDGSNPCSTSNPLLIVSRSWAYCARLAIRAEWAAGASAEWSLLAEILGSRSIAKVCCNMKLALSALQQRDVMVRGQLEDPVVAAALLRNTGFISEDVVATKKHQFQQVPPGKIIENLHYPQISLGTASSLSTVQIASYRACASMRSMAKLAASLRTYGMLELFVNVEMNVSQCLAEIEFNGMPLNMDLLTQYHQLTAERMQLIEFYFEHFQAKYHLPDKIGALKVKFVDDRKQRLLKEFVASLTEQGQRTNAMNVSIDKHAQAQQFHRQVDVLAAKAQAQAEVDISSHPLMVLHKEHQLLALSLHKLCATMIGCSVLDRIRGTSVVIGSETGRIIFKNPPLQMVRFVFKTAIIFAIFMRFGWSCRCPRTGTQSPAAAG